MASTPEHSPVEGVVSPPRDAQADKERRETIEMVRTIKVLRLIGGSLLLIVVI